ARRERAHRALAFARVIGQLGAGIGVALILATVGLPGGIGLIVGTLAAVILVGLSESVARSVGDTRGAEAARLLLPFIRTLEHLLAPVAAFGELIDKGLQNLLPPPDDEHEASEATAEQFKQVVAAEAEVSKDEQVLLNGVFRLADTEVHDLMVPRVDVVAIDRDDPWSEVVDRVRSAERSRLPVYAESIDNVIGVLYAKDMVPAVLSETEPSGGWTSLVRPAVFIPGAKKADAQLRDFQASGTHMAIVVDEFGGTAGIVTIEDVLEEIVGEIHDEYDGEEEASVEQEDGRRFWVSARLTLAELSELLKHDFEREDVTTVGGLVYELLGRVPKAGEEFVLDGFRVVVERVARRRVQRVFFEKLDVDAEHAA
ncbi:MAG TPA: hemolysin family protein, partial [Gemmatimonadaceae bacterium]|nr:hemolysin family protein [Gemmatimonadaceae bacterium]